MDSIPMVSLVWYSSNDMWDKEILAVLQVDGVVEESRWHMAVINYMNGRILI